MKKITLIFISLFFVASCQSTKDAFTLKKKSNTDEFLVEKKNPLVLPPDYGRLPVPQDGEINSYETEDTESDEFQILVDNDKPTLPVVLFLIASSYLKLTESV